MDAKLVAKELVDTAKEAAGKHDHIKCMTIEVGQLATISVPALAKEVALLLPFTAIEIKEKKAKVKCSCGFSGAPKVNAQSQTPDFSCPKCARKYPDVLEGDSVELKDIEVE